MLLEIDDNKRVSDLQEKFNQCFPNLKIEFYHWHYKWAHETASENLIGIFSRVEAIRRKHEPGILQIRSDDKIEKVENEFKERFGLNVKVFHLQKGEWVATDKTRNLTIQQLMALSRAVDTKTDDRQGQDDDESYDLLESI